MSHRTNQKESREIIADLFMLAELVGSREDVELRGLVLGRDSGAFLMSWMFGGFILRSLGAVE